MLFLLSLVIAIVIGVDCGRRGEPLYVVVGLVIVTNSILFAVGHFSGIPFLL